MRLLACLALLACSGGGTDKGDSSDDTGPADDTGIAPVDADGDGYPSQQTGGSDCDDTDPEVHPGATETCNGLDDDCDGQSDEDDAQDAGTWYADTDADGFGDPARTARACEVPSGYVADATDCDDGKTLVNPSAVEVCGDWVDDNCDGLDGECATDLSLGEVGIRLDGEAEGDQAGFAVAAAGDTDGDGAIELAVSAPQFVGHTNTGPGRVYLVGSASLAGGGLAAAEARVSGEADGDWFGYSVAGVGDLDHDGFDDLLIGAREARTDSVETGGAWVFLGPLSGNVAVSDARAALWGSEFDAAAEAVLGAGDVDGDGAPELIVTAPGLDALDRTDNGVVYLVDAEVEGSLALADTGTRVIGATDYADAGSSVAAGDIDGDGLVDLLVGTPGEGDVHEQAAAAYVVYGPVTSDVDLAGVGDRLLGPAAKELDTAAAALALPGDMDGDGYADIAVGDFWEVLEPRGWETGCAYLVNGPLRGEIELVDADARLFGEAQSDQAGYAVSGIGDLDADGRADLLVGAPGVRNPVEPLENFGGVAYVVLGMPEGVSSLGEADLRLSSEGGFDFAAYSVAGAGDLDSDGVPDLLVGAPGVSPAGEYTYYGAAYMVPGSGL